MNVLDQLEEYDRLAVPESVPVTIERAHLRALLDVARGAKRLRQATPGFTEADDARDYLDAALASLLEDTE